jgi:hypothetical protein
MPAMVSAFSKKAKSTKNAKSEKKKTEEKKKIEKKKKVRDVCFSAWYVY